MNSSRIVFVIQTNNCNKARTNISMSPIAALVNNGNDVVVTSITALLAVVGMTVVSISVIFPNVTIATSKIN